MAEKLFAHALNKEDDPLGSLKVVSAGISAIEGDMASMNSVRVLQKVGLDLSNHCSKRITRELVEKSSAIFCMTETHRYLIRELFPDSNVPIILFRGKMPSPGDVQIRDPFGMHMKEYEECRDQIVEAIPSLLKYLKELLAV